MALRCLTALRSGPLSPSASGAFPGGEACSRSAAPWRAQPHRGGAKALQSKAIISYQTSCFIHSKLTKNIQFSWLGELLGNLHAVCNVPARE